MKSDINSLPSGNPYAVISDSCEFEESLSNTKYALRESRSVSFQSEFNLDTVDTVAAASKHRVTVKNNVTPFPSCHRYAHMSTPEFIDEEEKEEVYGRYAQVAASAVEFRSYLKAFLENYSPAFKVGGTLSSMRKKILNKVSKITKESRICFLKELDSFNLLSGMDNYEPQFQRDDRSSDVDKLIEQLEEVIDRHS